MKNIFTISCFIVMVLSNGQLFAQNEEGRSGTVYSSYGTGFPLLYNTAQEKALGIPGISFNDLRTGGLTNPSFWGHGGYSRIVANFDFTNYQVNQGISSGNNTIFNFGSFHAVLPLSKNKLGLSVALYPESTSNYNFDSEGSVTFGNSEFDYFANNIGTGGITKFEIGLGYKLNNIISVGYAPSYSFLTEKEKKTISFLDNGILRQNISSSRLSGSSLSHRFGILLTKSSLFNDDDIVQLGASLNLPTMYNADRKTESDKSIQGSSSRTVQIGDTETADVSTPLKLGLGLTYFASPKFNISLELQDEKWSEAEYKFSNTEESFLKNRQFYGLGVQFHPYKSRSTGFLKNFKYSLGVSYDTGHLNIQGEDINTLWFSTGLGLISPNLRSASSFDLSFQYGMRGTTSQNLVKENIFSINLSINLTELMFLQRKLN